MRVRVALLAALLSRALGAPSWPPCGWPVLKQNYVRPAAQTTKLAQHLLNLTADGVFGPATTAAVVAFQRSAGIKPADGFLDAATWPALVASATPTRVGAVGAAVAGAQGALNAFGFPVAQTGRFDAATVAALGAFAAARGAADTSGTVLDAQLWHLLSSGCNASATSAAFWIDVGWPQGSLSVATLACLRARFGFVTFECWRETSFWFAPCAQNVANAHAAGFARNEVGVYMFPVRAADPASQVRSFFFLAATGAPTNFFFFPLTNRPHGSSVTSAPRARSTIR